MSADLGESGGGVKHPARKNRHHRLCGGLCPEWHTPRLSGDKRGAPDGAVRAAYIAGSSTESITWITPFDCFTSAMVTVAIRS